MKIAEEENKSHDKINGLLIIRCYWEEESPYQNVKHSKIYVFVILVYVLINFWWFYHFFIDVKWDYLDFP